MIDSLISEFRAEGGKVKGAKVIEGFCGVCAFLNSEFRVEGGKEEGQKVNVFVMFCAPSS